MKPGGQEDLNAASGESSTFALPRRVPTASALKGMRSFVTFRITRPGVDVAERSEPAGLFRLAFIRLFCHVLRLDLLCVIENTFFHSWRKRIAFAIHEVSHPFLVFV